MPPMNYIKVLTSSQFIIPFIIFIFSTIGNCNRSTGAGDNFLFGVSEAFERAFGGEPVVACTSDVTISTKSVSLVEDGNVAATFSTSEESGFTKVVTGGTYGMGSSQLLKPVSTPTFRFLDLLKFL